MVTWPARQAFEREGKATIRMREGGVPLSLFVSKPASQANGHPKGFAHSSLFVFGINLGGFLLKFLLNKCYEHNEILLSASIWPVPFYQQGLLILFYLGYFLTVLPIVFNPCLLIPFQQFYRLIWCRFLAKSHNWTLKEVLQLECQTRTLNSCPGFSLRAGSRLL